MALRTPQQNSINNMRFIVFLTSFQLYLGFSCTYVCLYNNCVVHIMPTMTRWRPRNINVNTAAQPVNARYGLYRDGIIKYLREGVGIRRAIREQPLEKEFGNAGRKRLGSYPYRCSDR